MEEFLTAEESAEMIAQLDAYHIEVGRIASIWASLELVVDLLIWKMLKVNGIFGACVTSQIPSIHTKCRCLVALFELYDGSKNFAAAINKFNGAVRSTAEKRNRIIHDAWAIGASKEVSQITKAIKGKSVELGFTTQEFEGMSNLKKEISAHILELHKLSGEVADWLATSPKILREPIPNITLGRESTSVLDS